MDRETLDEERLEELRNTAQQGEHNAIETYLNNHCPERLAPNVRHILGSVIASLNKKMQGLTDNSATERKIKDALTERRNAVAGIMTTKYWNLASEAAATALQLDIVPTNDTELFDDLRQEALIGIWEMICRHDYGKREEKDSLNEQAWSTAKYRILRAIAQERNMSVADLRRVITVRQKYKDSNDETMKDTAWALASSQEHDLKEYRKFVHAIHDYQMEGHAGLHFGHISIDPHEHIFQREKEEHRRAVNDARAEVYKERYLKKK